MACAPAIVPLVGGTVSEAIEYSRTMAEITEGFNPNLTIPVLGFRDGEAPGRGDLPAGQASVGRGRPWSGREELGDGLGKFPGVCEGEVMSCSLDDDSLGMGEQPGDPPLRLTEPWPAVGSTHVQDGARHLLRVARAVLPGRQRR